MDTTLYNAKKQYAEQLLADLEAREKNGEIDANLNSEWRKSIVGLMEGTRDPRGFTEGQRDDGTLQIVK